MHRIHDDIILNWRKTRRYCRFAFGAVRRHLWLATATWASVVGLAALAFHFLPKTYEVEARVLTHRTYVMPALVSPRRAVPWFADVPTQGAVELVFEREGLRQVVISCDLLNLIRQHRTPLLRIKDRVREALRGPVPDEYMQDAMVDYLGELLRVQVVDDVVIMSFRWKNPVIAMALTEAAVARFLQTRRDLELNEIVETVRILEHGQAVATQRVDVVMGDLQTALRRRQEALSERKLRRHRAWQRTARAQSVRAIDADLTTGRPNPALADASNLVGNAELASVQRQYHQARAAREAVEKQHEERSLAAQEKLSMLRAHLGPDHPDVTQEMKALQEVSTPPPGILVLRGEESRLAAQLRSQKAEVAAPASPSTDSLNTLRLRVSLELSSLIHTDPELLGILDEVEKRRVAYDDIAARLQNARNELDTANAAYALRYQVTKPAALPREPVKPQAAMVFFGAILAGFVVAVFVAISADNLIDAIVEPWQAEVELRIPLLGEIELPS